MYSKPNKYNVHRTTYNRGILSTVSKGWWDQDTGGHGQGVGTLNMQPELLSLS